MLAAFSNIPFILASASPRRKKLMEDLGFKITVKPVDVEENYPDFLKPKEVVLYLAALKSEAFGDVPDDGSVLITSDTVVAFNDKVLGKPATISEARRMLQQLSGKQHTVVSGVCLRSKMQRKTFYVSTEVFFKKLSDEEIEFYLANFEVLDKAGSYGIQEWIGMIGVKRIEGCYYNVMGLPMQKLYKNLKHFLEPKVEEVF